MWLKPSLLLLLFICLNGFSISDARAGGTIDPETIPYLMDDRDVDPLDDHSNGTDSFLDDLSPDEDGCLSSSSLECNSAKPEIETIFQTALVKDLYLSLAQDAMVDESNDTGIADLSQSRSSGFNINIDTILDTFHDVYQYYLPIPTSLITPNLAVYVIKSNPDALVHDSTFSEDSADTSIPEEESSGGTDYEYDDEDHAHAKEGQLHSQDVEEFIEDELVPPSLSLECESDVLAMYDVFNWTRFDQYSRAAAAATLLENMWALKMMDSWGKAEDGILSGNLRRVGFMQQCLNTVANTSLGFTGQYCLVQPVKTSNLSLAGLLPSMYGTCIPSSCTTEELQASLDYQLAPLQHKAGTVSCQQLDEPIHFDTWEIVSCSIIGSVLLLVVVSSLADLYYGDETIFIFKAFSAVENMGKIWAVKSPHAPGEISCMFGIRVLSISWIILGHHYAYILEYGVNKADLPKMTSGLAFQMVWSGYKAVDTFFTISGILLIKYLIKEDFCIDSSSESLELAPNVEPMDHSSTLTLVRESPSRSIKTRAEEQSRRQSSDGSTTSSTPTTTPTKITTTTTTSCGVSSPYIDYNLWHQLRKQGFQTSASNFFSVYFRYIFHRIVRLWPTMFLIIMYCAGPSSFFVSGPYKPRYENEYLHACRYNWWVDLTFFSNILFVLTGLKAENHPEENRPVDSCISHSWYIAVDLQLQLILPFLILPIKLFKHKGLYMLCLIFVASLIPGIVVVVMNLMPAMMMTLDPRASLDYSRAIYMMPYARAAPYLVGGLCGLLLHQAGEKNVRKCPLWLDLIRDKNVQFIMWTVFSVGSMVIVFGLWSSNRIASDALELSSFEDFLYASAASTAWAACVGWMVVACTLGIAGPINAFLSHPMWQPLSRVSYPVYLISLPIQKIIFYSFNRDIYLTHTMIILSCVGVVALSFLASFAISLVAESPFISLNKGKAAKKVPETPESASQASNVPLV